MIIINGEVVEDDSTQIDPVFKSDLTPTHTITEEIIRQTIMDTLGTGMGIMHQINNLPITNYTYSALTPESLRSTFDDIINSNQREIENERERQQVMLEAQIPESEMHAEYLRMLDYNQLPSFLRTDATPFPESPITDTRALVQEMRDDINYNSTSTGTIPLSTSSSLF